MESTRKDQLAFKRWVPLLVIVLVIGFAAGDRYARYSMYQEQLEIGILVQQAEESTLLPSTANEIDTQDVIGDMLDEELIQDALEVIVQENVTIIENGKTTPETKIVAEQPITTAFGNGKINLNTASKEVLMSLDGIGETKAEAIIAYRTQYGDFIAIEELMNVEGIGEKTFEKNKTKITVR